MRQLFTRNVGWKLLSLGIAIGLWISVAREPEVATSVSVPLDFRNPPDDLDIRGALPDRIRLEVRGPSGRLTGDNLAAVAVVLDLADATPGERTYTIRDHNVNLPSDIRFDRAIPAQITLRFEQLMVKEEPVQPVFVNMPEGYRIASEQFTPNRVRIRSTEDHLVSIDVIRTDPISLQGFTGERTIRTHLNVGDPQVRLSDSSADITVRVRLEKISSGRSR